MSDENVTSGSLSNKRSGRRKKRMLRIELMGRRFVYDYKYQPSESLLTYFNL
jgi:hypothetical protein